MMTIILAVALLSAITCLGVEIGIALWNIRRANRYQRRAAAAERTTERTIGERRGMARRNEGRKPEAPYVR